MSCRGGGGGRWENVLFWDGGGGGGMYGWRWLSSTWELVTMLEGWLCLCEWVSDYIECTSTPGLTQAGPLDADGRLNATP